MRLPSHQKGVVSCTLRRQTCTLKRQNTSARSSVPPRSFFLIITSGGHSDPDYPERTYAYHIVAEYEDADGVVHTESVDGWCPDDDFYESDDEAWRAAQAILPMIADLLLDDLIARGVALATREYIVH